MSMCENDIDNELRNLPLRDVKNAKKFIRDYWQQIRMAKELEKFDKKH